jgi:hypothetical protein
MGWKLFNNFSIGKFFLFVILAFVFITVVSMLANQFFPTQTWIKEPSIPLLFLTVIIACIPAFMIVNDGKLTQKDWIGLGASMIIILVLLTILPAQFPDYFTNNIYLSDVLKNFWDSLKLFQSVIGLQ